MESRVAPLNDSFFLQRCGEAAGASEFDVSPHVTFLPRCFGCKLNSLGGIVFGRSERIFFFIGDNQLALHYDHLQWGVREPNESIALVKQATSPTDLDPETQRAREDIRR
ncbi:jg23540 [Pararge aegeria aegeria]|uniref:Jg23540 protein n=1 Tax=Pararge aegeria aegeria TaxID=348720 RepID=A0A8S4QHR4_9NEOP|nr:jg23540 [Pararge aegeria aegeria]